MDVRGRFVHDVDKQLNETIGHHVIVAMVAQFEGVVEEDVCLELVVIGVDNLEIFLSDAACRLVLVHVEDGLEHGQHLVGGLVPHGGAGVDARDGIGRLDSLGCGATRFGSDGNGLVVLCHVRVGHTVAV